MAASRRRLGITDLKCEIAAREAMQAAIRISLLTFACANECAAGARKRPNITFNNRTAPFRFRFSAVELLIAPRTRRELRGPGTSAARLAPLPFFFFLFLFFYSICASVSLSVVLRGVFESFAFLYLGLSLLAVVVLDCLRSWRLPCRKTPAAGFPGRLLCCVSALTVLQHLRCPV